MKKGILLLHLLLFTICVSAQTITTFAGSGTSGSIPLGDGGPATAAYLPNPIRGVFDKEGNFYVPSTIGGNRVRKIDVFGVITTVAGTGIGGYNGDGIPATSAKLNMPSSVALDSAGNLYICENGSRIRKVDKTTGIITTYAGTGSVAAGPDGVPATASALNDPIDIEFDKHNNLYVCEYFSNKIRKINPSGIITTFAGNGVAGYSGDGARADTSRLSLGDIAFDTLGNIFMADAANSIVIKIDTGLIMSTVAGTHTGYLYNGDEIPATTANIDPYGLAIDDSGNLFIAENQNYRVRKVDHWGIIHTVAGNGISGFSGDDGPATNAKFSYPSSLRFDQCGNLYVSDANNARVRKVWLNGIGATPVVTITSASSDTVCAGSSVVFNAAVSSADSTLTYKWYVNGVAISAATNASYSYTPTNGDTVNCKVQAFVACNGAFTVSSNTIHLTTIAGGSPTISLTGVSAAAIGATVTLTASISGAGSSYTIHWMNHNTQFAATTVPTVSYIKGSGTDTITARIVPNGSCYDSTTSAIHIVTRDRTGVGCVHNDDIIIYPNPMSNILHIDNAEAYNSYIIYDITGRKLMSDSLAPTNNSINTLNLEKGIYLLELQSATAPPQVIRVSK